MRSSIEPLTSSSSILSFRFRLNIPKNSKGRACMTVLFRTVWDQWLVCMVIATVCLLFSMLVSHGCVIMFIGRLRGSRAYGGVSFLNI